jgi:hypothetical protein
VENLANSTVATVCEQLDKSGLLDKSDKNYGIHGMALGICVEKDLDESKFMMHAQMQTSFSSKMSVTVKIAHQDDLIIFYFSHQYYYLKVLSINCNPLIVKQIRPQTAGKLDEIHP